MTLLQMGMPHPMPRWIWMKTSIVESIDVNGYVNVFL